MKYRNIRPKRIKLQLLNTRNNILVIMLLLYHTKSKHKNRVLRRNRIKTRVTRLIHKNYKVTKIHYHSHPTLIVVVTHFRKLMRITVRHKRSTRTVTSSSSAIACTSPAYNAPAVLLTGKLPSHKLHTLLNNMITKQYADNNNQVDVFTLEHELGIPFKYLDTWANGLTEQGQNIGYIAPQFNR